MTACPWSEAVHTGH